MSGSFKKFLHRCEVPQTEEEAGVWQNNVWLNRDNVPLPPERRSWGPLTFVGYWLTIGINIVGWTSGSSLLGLGLSVPQAIGTVIIGFICIAAAVIGTGAVGAKWHVGFPMWNRMTWGMRASYFPLINRIILSFTWTSTQAWFGGQVVKTFLGSMFPSIYTMANTFPESSFLTTADFICFLVFLALQFSLLHVPPEKFRKPFVVVSITSSITCITMLIWALAAAKGAGPLVSYATRSTIPSEAVSHLVTRAGGSSGEVIDLLPKRVAGSDLAWAMVRGISSVLGSWCAGVLNMSDYSRFARTRNAPIISQLVVVPLFGIITCVIGILCTSAAAQLYPEEGLLWQPYALLSAIQKNGGAGARAAVFFASLAFILSQLGINIPCNAISGGIDLASLFPMYINIRRGAYITTLMALPMCPWALVSGATVFISVMGGYATFLAPMTGIMICDYFLIRKQNMKLSALYECNPSSAYYYWKGVNWRAPVAWVLAVIPVFPGFLQSVSTVTIPDGLNKIYFMCWPLGFLMSGTIYYVLCKVAPLKDPLAIDAEDIFGTFGPAPVHADPEAEEIPGLAEKEDAPAPYLVPVISK